MRRGHRSTLSAVSTTVASHDGAGAPPASCDKGRTGAARAPAVGAALATVKGEFALPSPSQPVPVNRNGETKAHSAFIGWARAAPIVGAPSAAISGEGRPTAVASAECHPALVAHVVEDQALAHAALTDFRAIDSKRGQRGAEDRDAGAKAAQPFATETDLRR